MAGLYGSGSIKSEAYTRYVICEKMGWDFYTYMAQPPFFIEEILLIMYHVNQKEQHESKALEQKADGALTKK